MSHTVTVIAEFSAIPGSAFRSAIPLAIRTRFAGRAHEAAHKDADPRIDAVVKSLIKPDPVLALSALAQSFRSTG